MAATWEPIDVDADDDDPPPLDGWRVLLAELDRRRPAWQAEAACADADPALFFVELGGSTDAGKALCASCPTVGECRLYALELDARHGTWAGESARKLKREKGPTPAER